ncbi:hypothetical protein BKA93DRAFT_594288 [Sparassis latifolia]
MPQDPLEYQQWIQERLDVRSVFLACSPYSRRSFIGAPTLKMLYVHNRGNWLVADTSSSGRLPSLTHLLPLRFVTHGLRLLTYRVKTCPIEDMLALPERVIVDHWQSRHRYKEVPESKGTLSWPAQFEQRNALFGEVRIQNWLEDIGIPYDMKRRVKNS